MKLKEIISRIVWGNYLSDLLKPRSPKLRPKLHEPDFGYHKLLIYPDGREEESIRLPYSNIETVIKR